MTNDSLRVLVIDDEKPHAEAVAESLERVGYDCVIATSGQQGARRMEDDEYDLILTDLRMAGLDGLAILRRAKELLPDAEVVVITGHGDVKTAVEAIKRGAADFVTKPFQFDELMHVLHTALEQRRLKNENAYLRQQLDERYGLPSMIGRSPRMRSLF